MSLTTLSAAEAAPRLGEFDAVIDVRSPAEFAEDHLPGALNWPVLDDDERHIVGMLYKQVSPHEARKVGAAMVSRRIADTLEHHAREMPREWRPLVYCWRGGQRSGSLALVLGQVGFRTTQLAGGYRAFRAVVREDLARWPLALRLVVLCGRTGSGKTRLLEALAARGAQVLDLEALACHRGSILGAMPTQAQPSQKRFDTLVWQALKPLDPTREVYVESESARIGSLRVPEALLTHLRENGRCVRVEMDDATRTRLLTEDYAELIADPHHFCRLLEGLIELRGHACVTRWQDQARQGHWNEVIAELMSQHYDPLYEQSMRRSFARLDEAPRVVLHDIDAQAIDAAAAELLRSAHAEPAPALSSIASS